MTRQHPNLTSAKAHSDDHDSAREQRLMEAMEEYRAAYDAGRPFDGKEFIDRYSDIADELADCMAGMELIQGVAKQVEVAPDELAVTTTAKTVEPTLQVTALGDFRILQEIGRGGMGVVYEAEQLSVGRSVALKVLPFAGVLDERQLARFKNESRAAGSLDHPNIVSVISVGSERGVHYYAMQLVKGQSLAEIIADLRGDKDAVPAVPTDAETKPVAALSTERETDSGEFFRRIARLGIQAAEALDHAHGVGIVHRDIKPSNLMIDMAGKLLITDFGLAQIQGEGNLTMTGDLVGTLRYMSPEQADGDRAVLDHRADIYSLGITLFELLTLRPAFVGTDKAKLLRDILEHEPPAPHSINNAMPRDLETIVLKAINKEPDDRYANGTELAADLRRFVDGAAVVARRRSPIEKALRWSRRHRSIVASVVVTLFLTLAISSLLLTQQRNLANAARDSEQRQRVEAERQRDEAERQKLRAVEKVKLARSLVDSVYLKLGTQWIADNTASSLIQRQILVEASKFYQELVENSNHEFDLGEMSLVASGYHRIGIIEHHLQNYFKAANARSKAISIIHDALSRYPQDIDMRTNASELYYDLGQSLIELARFEEATEALIEGAGFAKELSQQQMEHPKYLLLLSRFDLSRATVLARSGSLAQAGQLAKVAKVDLDALMKQVKGEQPFWGLIRSERFRADYWLAKILAAQGELDAAWKECQDSLDRCRRFRGVNGYDDARNLTREIDLLELSAELAGRRGDLETAAQQYGHVLDMRRKSFRSKLSPQRFFMESLFKNSINMDGLIEPGPFCGYLETQQQLAQLLSRMNRPYAAEQFLGECDSVVTAIIAERPNSLRYHVAHANTKTLVAELLADRRSGDALTAYREAKKLWTEINETFPHGKYFVSGILGLQPDWERFQNVSGLFGEVEVAVANNALKGPHETVFHNHSIGRGWYSDRLWQAAINSFQRSADLRTDDHAYDWLYLAMAHAELGELEESRAWFDKADDAMMLASSLHPEQIELREQARKVLDKRTADFNSHIEKRSADTNHSTYEN